MAKIIVAEDEAIVAMSTKMMLRDLSHETISIVSTAERAVNEVLLQDADLILMDIKLKGIMDGIEAAEEIRKTTDIPILFITGNSDLKTKQRISNIKNSTTLLKPVMIGDLRVSLNKLLN